VSILKSLKKIGFSKLTLLDDALKMIQAHITPASLDEVETSKALNRILATDIISELDIPPFDRSAMDGYAVKAEDTFGASPSNPKIINKIGTIEIGEQTDLVLRPGEAIRISTGATIPQGSNSVIKIEDTDINGDKVSLYTSIVPGKNVSKKGEDIPLGTEILKSGIIIKASHIALLSSLGIKHVRVKEKPKVSVFAVGDELIEVGDPLPTSKIYNSNSPMVSSLVETYGGSVVRAFNLKDNKDEIRNNLVKRNNARKRSGVSSWDCDATRFTCLDRINGSIVSFLSTRYTCSGVYLLFINCWKRYQEDVRMRKYRSKSRNHSKN